jgi:hypothetical protein
MIMPSKKTFPGHAALMATAVLVNATAIPHPTGPYGVGVRKLVIEHYNDHDPIAPNNISTSFLATIFYPTDSGSKKNDTGPYLDPRTAQVWEDIYNFTKGSLASLTSTLQKDAPFLVKEEADDEPLKPTLLFGPGAAGPSTECNSILLSDLASHGYTAIGLDHPYEHEWLRYPNGTYIPGIPLDYPWTLDELIALYETRLEDSLVFLDQLPQIVETLKAPINTTHIGTFGHSLGGAAAIGSLQDSDHFRSGIDLDGTLWGTPAVNSIDADTKKPSLLLGFEGHFDESYRTYPDFQTAYFRGVRINGTVHNDFSDVSFWKTVGTPDPPGGTIGERMVHILRTLVGDFFDYTLLGGEPPAILDGPTEGYPEVWYFNGEGPIS